MNCRTCNNDCFSIISDGCVGYTGGNFPKLGIENGMSIRDVWIKLLTTLTDIATKLERCNFCDEDMAEIQEVFVPASTVAQLQATTTTCSANITNTNFSYQVIGSTTGITVTYSMEDVVKNLPKGYGVISTTFKAYSTVNSKQVASLSTSVGSFNVAVDSMPIRIHFTVLVNTPCGHVEIDRYYDVSEVSAASVVVTGTVKDYGQNTFRGEVTQNAFNDIVSQKIVGLDRDTNKLKNLNISPTQQVPMAARDIETVLQTLINNVDAIKSRL